jgi:predicted RNase H-like nuclease (RuvC/YqgF family)
MQPLQIANKVSRMLSLVTRLWRENQKLRERMRVTEVDYEMLSHDLDRLSRRLDSLERTDSRMRQAAY